MTDEPLTDSRLGDLGGLGDLGDLLAFDRAHVWHPYSSALAPQDPYLVESASGVRLRLRRPDGSTRECIDAMSSWWCAIHGYAVPELDAAARSQLDRMSHVMFGGLTHEPAIALARRLIDLAPRHTGAVESEGGDGRSPLQHVFFADSGSVAIEVAMKMALQVHVADGRPRRRFFTIRGGYHGDTFSPMSVTDPDGGMHSLWRGILPEHVFALHPPAPGADLTEWEAQTRALYAAHAPDIAAVIVEPTLQGAGGMTFHDARVVQVLAELARASGALVIFDEIATGFGRTGTMWGADQAGVVPDVMAVGKALTGGYLTLSAVLCTTNVAERVSGGEAGGLMHGPTFMANPLACAIAGASLDLLARDPGLSQVARIERGLMAGLAPARALDSVGDVRVRGAVGVIQLREPVRGKEIAAYAVERGVWVRPFRDLVYTMPPYVTSDEDLATLTGVLVDAVAAVHG
ncbi:MAG TPA: adenosylmethionine--8-amino-7-oxononanoate transaminase [Dermatophilaceae bacterium]|nr:adenosylmethionine--8-amino-7-oxononanoate transaminase [Dermatophilaceae bacterium]